MKYFLILLLLILVSCNPTPIDNYKGYVVDDKQNGFVLSMRLLYKDTTLIQDYHFTSITVSKQDFERYQTGDTIK